jgi:hypothetical protein
MTRGNRVTAGAIVADSGAAPLLDRTVCGAIDPIRRVFRATVASRIV